MGKRQAKHATMMIEISSLDAQQIALIMRLHFSYALDQAQKCNVHLAQLRAEGKATDREYKSRDSWARQARKAWSYAEQFENIKLDCIDGKTSSARLQ